LNRLKLLWHDRSGRFSALKAIVLLGCFIPGLWLAVEWSSGDLGARPVTEVIHGTGQWAVRLLLLCLLVSPARRIFVWHRLILVRRMLGLAAAAYAFSHFCLYIVDENGQMLLVISEIIKRFYLTIGFVTLLSLLVLSATSTDAMLARLGRSWITLHRSVYLLTALALFHFMLQSKADIREAVITAGLYAWLMLWRTLPGHYGRNLLVLLALAFAAGIVTAGLEAGWYQFATALGGYRVLMANLRFNLDYGLRPSAWVTIVCLGVFAAATLQRVTDLMTGKKRGGRQTTRRRDTASAPSP
jgi:sulfoxide reductase heme-binding subunit YedZ